MARRAFSLLELLVTLAIVASLAGVVLINLSGVQHAASSHLSLQRLERLRQALLRFHSDTGHFPGSGPFALAEDGVPGEVATPDAGSIWFRCPANLEQLYRQPQSADGKPVLPFNPDSGRGWRGPYLEPGLEWRVQLGAGLAPNGVGSPQDGDLLSDVPCLPDAWEHGRLAGTTLEVSLARGSAGAVSGGRPILLFRQGDSLWLVSCGADGRYGSPAADADNLVLELSR